jgi:hypothetical protein
MPIIPEAVAPATMDDSQHHGSSATMLHHLLERRAIAQTPNHQIPRLEW